MKPGRLNIGLIGSDVAGVALAQALQESSHLVVALTDQVANDFTDFVFPAAHEVSIETLMSISDLVIVAQEKGALTSTAELLAGHARSGQILLHADLSFDHTVFHSALERGAIAIALWPVMSFTGTSMDIARMRESYFAVSADNFALPIAQALTIELGAEPIVIDQGNRVAFAEAIEVASNFSAMIVNQSIGLLEQAGVASPASVIAPVIRSAVERALARGHKNINPEDLMGED